MVYWYGFPALSLLQLLPPLNRSYPHKWTSQILPATLHSPKITPMDETSRIAAALVTSIQRLQSKEERHLSCHATSLEKLANIFNKNTCDIPGVKNPTHQTSTHPTAPEVINTTPRVQQRTKRSNTPGMLPPCSRVITPPNFRVPTYRGEITHNILV